MVGDCHLFLGHCPKVVLDVLKEQAQTLWHVSNLYWIPPQIQLAEKLIPRPGLTKPILQQWRKQ